MKAKYFLFIVIGVVVIIYIIFDISHSLTSVVNPDRDIQREFDRDFSRAGRSIEIAGREFDVRVADSNKERGQGLNDVDEIARREGMLFIWEEEGRQSIHMDRVTFPIDILWANAEFEIVHIEREVQPGNLFIFSPATKAKYVIEANGDAFDYVDIGDFISP